MALPTACDVNPTVLADYIPPVPTPGNMGCSDRNIRVLFLATPEIINAPGYSDVLTSLNTQIQYAKNAFRRSLEWTGRQSATIDVVNNVPIRWDYNSGARQFANEVAWVNYILADEIPVPQVYSERMLRSRSSLANNPTITQLKIRYNADVVVIYHLSPATSFPNQANAIQFADLAINGIQPTPDNAFILMRHLTTGFSSRGLFAHELGHILGGQHHNSTTIFPSNEPRYGFYQEYPAILNPNVTLQRTTIMAIGSDPSSDIFSSPQFVERGVIYANLKEDGFSAIIPSDYQSANPKDLATNTNLSPPLTNPIPLGTAAVNNVTAIIDKNVPVVAGYAPSGSVNLLNVPRSLKRATQNSDCATITVRATACSPGMYQTRYYAWTNTQRLTPLSGEINNAPNLPGTQTSTIQVCMPNDGSLFVQGVVVLEIIDGTTGQFIELASQNFFISCQDCYPQPMMAIFSKASSVQSLSGTSKRQIKPTLKEELPAAQLYQSSPNPARDKADVRFAIPRKSFVTLEVYNALGQRVSTLADGTMDAGEYVIPFEVQHLPSGFYTYKLVADNQTFVRTMMVVK